MLIETNEVEIPTWTEPETLCYLSNLASRSRIGLESGVYFGASARAMLQGNPAMHLWAVDKFMVHGSEQITRLFLREWIQSGHCEIIVGDSTRAAQMLPHMIGMLDYAFVDDGHAEEDVRRDIRFLLPLIKPGGLLLGHDFDIPHNDVARGVLSMIPMKDLTFPCPRLWSFKKPDA